ncbi:hypothetical protein ADUPG1_007936, partial [Aduncisulcus paluster]
TKLSEMATENTHLHAVIAKCVSRLKECFDMLRRTHDIRYSFDSIISSLQPLSFDSYSSGPSLQQPLTSGSPLFPAISFPALPQLISHPSSLPQVPDVFSGLHACIQTLKEKASDSMIKWKSEKREWKREIEKLEAKIKREERVSHASSLLPPKPPSARTLSSTEKLRLAVKELLDATNR